MKHKEYVPPLAEIDETKAKKSESAFAASVRWILTLSVVFFVAKGVLPVINMAVSSLFFEITSISYQSLRFLSDLFFTPIVFVPLILSLTRPIYRYRAPFFSLGGLGIVLLTHSDVILMWPDVIVIAPWYTIASVFTEGGSFLIAYIIRYRFFAA